MNVPPCNKVNVPPCNVEGICAWMRETGGYTAVLSEAWTKLRDWASVAGRGRLLLSGSVAHASSKPLY